LQKRRQQSKRYAIFFDIFQKIYEINVDKSLEVRYYKKLRAFYWRILKMKNINMAIMIIFAVFCVNLHAQEVISLQGFGVRNTSQYYDQIVQQYEFHKIVIERQFSNPSFDYVHFAVLGNRSEEGDGDIIRFFTEIDMNGKDLIITIERYLNGWYCIFQLVFTNKGSIGAFLDAYSCKKEEDTDKFWKSYKYSLKKYIGIDFDRSDKLIIIRPETYGGTFG
jgi:hypothetical protein